MRRTCAGPSSRWECSAVLAGTVSVYVLLRRLAFIGDTLTHSVFPGVVVAFVLGQSLFLGALVAGVVAALLVTAVTRSRRIDDDAALGVVLATMFAIGVVIVSHQRSYTSDLTALAFGRILAVDTSEIIVSAVVAVVVLGVLATLHKELVFRAFDPVATEALGYRVGALDLVLNLAIALVVVAAVKAVGTVLVVALIVVPGATARLLTDRLSRMIVIACAITALCGWVGLATSYDISLHHGVGSRRARRSWWRSRSRSRAPRLCRCSRRVELDWRRRHDLLPRLATSELLRRAVMEAVGVGALCGALGAHVVLRRLSFFTVTISHATFPGVVIASILGASLFLGGAVTAMAVVVAVGIVGSQRRLDSSTATGVVLAGAFALGVLLLSAQPRATTDLTSFLVGSLLTVSNGDLVLTAVVAVVVVAVMSALHKELVLGAFDREGAEALGFRPLWLDLAVLTLVAITVVTAVPAVGTILVVALLVTPALTARLWTERIGSMMLLGRGARSLLRLRRTLGSDASPHRGGRVSRARLVGPARALAGGTRSPPDVGLWSPNGDRQCPVTAPRRMRTCVS